MIAALIVMFSVTALLEFAVSQWRSMWITVATQPLSSCLEAATGIAEHAIRAEHFDRLAQTSEKLCPSPEQSNLWLKEVRVYYQIVRSVAKVLGSPAVSGWAANELLSCSRYAAVVLDQRLNANLAFASEVRNF